MNTYQLIYDNLHRVKSELSDVHRILHETSCPDGTLVFKSYKDRKVRVPFLRTSSYENPDSEPTDSQIQPPKKRVLKDHYISKNHQDLAIALARKKYFQARLLDLQQEYAALSAFLRHYKSSEKRSDQMLRNCPELYDLLKNELTDLDEKLQRWCTEPYPRKKGHEEALIHETAEGTKVRSKSEVMIANELYYAGIPYRYECQHLINGSSYYPDFTIRNKRTGQMFIWEHFGLSTNRSYMADTVNKLANYADAGLVHGKNFIMTYESDKMPLSITTIRLMIETYLV